MGLVGLVGEGCGQETSGLGYLMMPNEPVILHPMWGPARGVAYAKEVDMA